MDHTSEQLHEPTVDDLRVKLCYICREEERHDRPPQPPPVWTHPCKCTLRDFGRSRGELKCPQCGELYEFEGFNPLILRIFNTVSVYLTCVTYGAFAVREFLGPDIFRTLLTTNPMKWPLHAWFYLPMIPFSLIVSRTPLVFWSTSPLVPLLFPWPSTIPVAAAAVAQISSRNVNMRGGRFAGRAALWPPPPALVCALFPFVRVLYGRLRDRIVRSMVQDLVPTRAQIAQRIALRRQQRRMEQGVQVDQRRGNQQDPPQRLQQQQERQPQQPPPPQQQQQEPIPPGAAHRFQLQVGEQFAFEFAHIVLDRNAPAPADVPGPAPAGPAVAAGNIAANGGGGAAVDNPADQQQQQQPAQARRPLPVPPPQRRAEPGQGQEPAPAPPARDANDLGAVAARAIRVTGASLGRLVGGALLMPTIARMMGSMLLHISHVVPLLHTIIAPLPPPLPPPPPPPPPSPSGPIGALFGLIRGGVRDLPQPDVALRGGATVTRVGYGTAVLRGVLATSQEWATSDPVWWRNALGLGVFLVVKDGMKILHLWLAKREIEERHIKNKSFAGIDLTELDLIERNK
ncbi:hypothetical protein BJV77DRAFT_1038384 [Russula vinacea]|nr:hypothetical protein BJV77DRAFT_1038384 [Russula vinacea]